MKELWIIERKYYHQGRHWELADEHLYLRPGDAIGKVRFLASTQVGWEFRAKKFKRVD